MILKRPADHEVYEYLIENYYKDVSISKISKAVKKSTPMVYKSIAMLKEKGFLQEKGTRYSVELLNAHTRRYKYLYDYEKFLNLPAEYKEKIIELKSKLNRMISSAQGFSLVVFGSLADGTFEKGSDIDILLILRSGIDSISSQLPDGFHFLLKTSLGFVGEVASGDDVALSICRSHIVIDDSGEFIGGIDQTKNTVGGHIIELRKNEARSLKSEMIMMYSENKKDEITKNLMLEKLQKLIKIESRVICLENGIVPTSKTNSFEEASKILKRDIKKEYENIRLDNVLEKVSSYV